MLESLVWEEALPLQKASVGREVAERLRRKV